MKISLTVFLFVGISASGQSNDSAAIAQLIINDYKTFENWDYRQHILHCQPHYKLIENGEIMSLANEVDYFKKNAHRSIKRKDKFDFLSIRVRGNTGYAVYRLASTIVENNKTKPYKWAESAVCEKVANRWKLALIHSTPVK